MQIISHTEDKTLIKEFEFNYGHCEQTKHRSWKDEVVSEITEGINKERIGTKYKPITERTVAIRINRNPYLKERNECYLLLKKCKEVGFTKMFFWATK